MGKDKNRSTQAIPLVDKLTPNSPLLIKYLEIYDNKKIKFNFSHEYHIDIPMTMQTTDVLKKSFFNKEQFTNTVKYINYFLTFFDEDKELLHIYYMMMANICASNTYDSLDDFYDDLYAKFKSESLVEKIIMMVEYNVPEALLQSKEENTFDKGLQLNDEHLKAIMGMGIFHKMIIPLISKMLVKNKELVMDTNNSGVRDVKKFYLYAMSMFVDLFDEHYGIELRNKVYNTSNSRVTRTEHAQTPMWERKRNTGVTTISFTNSLLNSVIVDISQKSLFHRSVVIYIHVCLDKNIKHSLQDDQDKFEFGSMEMRTSDSTDDSQSRYDKFQINASKVSEAYRNRVKVVIKDAIHRLCEDYEIKITEDEETFYRMNMGVHDTQVILLTLFYSKYFESYEDSHLIDGRNIPKLTAIMRRVLQANNYRYLPEIITGLFDVKRAKRINPRKVESMVKEDPLYEQLREKYSDIAGLINTTAAYNILNSVMAIPILKVDYDEQMNTNEKTTFDADTRMVKLARIVPNNNGKELMFNHKILINEVLRFVLLD